MRSEHATPLERISTNPDVLAEKPLVAGTRISVEFLPDCLGSACAVSLRVARIVFGGTDFCADSGQHFIAGYQLRAPCIYIRHAPGNLFIPSLGDGLRRIAGFAFQAGNQALD